jgi:hypothetical protein
LASADPGNRAFRVADIFLASEMKSPKLAENASRDAEKKKETVPVSADKLAAYAGEYTSEELFVTYVFALNDGKLMLSKIQNGLSGGFLQSTEHWELRPVGTDEFAVDEEGIRFTFSRRANQQITGFVLGAGRSSGITFARK